MEVIGKSERCGVDYQFVPPDGGWGYIVTLSYILFNYTTIVSLSSFGLLYGPFLASIGDETSGSSMLSSTFVAVWSFTGFASSFLLRRYSARVVGLVGATSYSLGYIMEIFGTNFTHMVIGYGVLKVCNTEAFGTTSVVRNACETAPASSDRVVGFGYGLMSPSSLTSMNSHFNKKHNLMMGVSLTVTSIGTIISPLIIAHMMENLGFRRTLGVLAGVSLINFPAMATFRPVSVYIQQSSKVSVTKPPSSLNHSKSQVEPLLQPNLKNEVTSVKPTFIPPLKGNSSSFSLLDLKDCLLDTIGLRLFGDLKYLNMAVGLSLPWITEGMFLMLTRMFLNNLKFESSDIALMMTVHFTFDVISKLSYSAFSGFYAINNRWAFLMASFLAAVVRIVFIIVPGHTWKMVTIAGLGLLKGIQEVPTPLVVSDMYKDNFSTAFSLNMVVTGCIYFIFAALTSYVRDLTQSDSMIIYLFAVSNFITCFSWIMENVITRQSERKTANESLK